MPSPSTFIPRTGVSLREVNTFGLEARAAFCAEVHEEEALPAAYAFARERGLPVQVIGGGSNLVLAHDIEGLVLLMRCTGRRLVEARPDAWIVEAAAGENWHDFVEWTLEAGYPGLENLALIPGTVGAAPIQNIGAYGLELMERFESVRLYDPGTDRYETLTTAQCAFAYRDSVFKHDRREAVVTSVRLRLPRPWQGLTHYGDVAAELAARGTGAPGPRDIFDAVVAIRRRKLPDPARIGNVGSFFKNPIVGAQAHARLKAQHPELVAYAQPDGRFKLAAGWLIDRCGYKGRAFGRVGVHAKQALVLVNLGGATGSEVLAAAEAIRQGVAERFGVSLEAEPVIL